MLVMGLCWNIWAPYCVKADSALGEHDTDSEVNAASHYMLFKQPTKTLSTHDSGVVAPSLPADHLCSAIQTQHILDLPTDSQWG